MSGDEDIGVRGGAAIAIAPLCAQAVVMTKGVQDVGICGCV